MSKHAFLFVMYIRALFMVPVQMESSSDSVHNNLNTIVDYQTHHRLREAQGRKRAEDLNARVLYWSIGETIAMLVIFVGQVFVLKGFFTERKTIVTT